MRNKATDDNPAMILCFFSFLCSIKLNGNRNAINIETKPNVKLLIGAKSGHHFQKFNGILNKVINDPTKINGNTSSIEFFIVTVQSLLAIF